jgi:hypothetical protein
MPSIQQIRADLVWLTEHCPNAETAFHALPAALAHTHIRYVFDLLCALDTLGVDFELEQLIDCVLSYQAAQIVQLDAALLAIKAHRLRAKLFLLLRALQIDVGADHDARWLAAIEATSCEPMRPFVLLNSITSNVANLEQLLWYYAQQFAHLRQLMQARRRNHGAVTFSPHKIDQVDAQSSGGYSLVVFRQRSAVHAMLQQWIASTRGGAWLYRAASKSAFSELPCKYGKLEHGVVIGRSLTPQTQHHLNLKQLACPDDDLMAQVASQYAWAIIALPNTMQETALAWLSADAELAADFISTAQSVRSEILSIYHAIDAFFQQARGAQFVEFQDYGEAALAAAQCDQLAPWLVGVL